MQLALALFLALLLTAPVLASPPIFISTAGGTAREFETELTLKREIAAYDLRPYTFTNQVVIQRGAMNHSFPEITLNVRYADAPDALLSSYIHEQLHWYLRDHNAQRIDGIRRLRRLFPDAPTRYPEGAGSAVSTYGHLLVCYLEMQADRRLLGQARTTAVIRQTPWYTWIWKTVVDDEATIAAVVRDEHLEIEPPAPAPDPPGPRQPLVP